MLGLYYRFLLHAMVGLLLAGSVWAEEVRVGLYQNEPKIFTAADGQPAGIFVDVLQEIATREGWQLRFVACEWQACLEQVSAGAIDLMPDVAWSEARAAQFDFHNTPALHSWSQLYTRKGAGIVAPPDLRGKRIAVLKGALQLAALQDMLRAFGVPAQVIPLETMDDVFAAVQHAEADAALANHFYGSIRAHRFDLVESPIVLQPARLFFATTRGRNPALLTAIDRHLEPWKQDASSPYFAALKRWGADLRQEIVPSRVWDALKLLGGSLLLTVAIVLLLRRRVRQQSAQLVAQNAQMQRMTRLYAALSQCNQAIVRCNDEAALFDQICRDTVEFGGMRMAWVGLLDADGGKVRPVASFGSGTDYLDGIDITIHACEPSGRGPTGVAMREDHPVWCQDFLHDPGTAPWVDRARSYGWMASAALPLHRRNKVVGALGLYSDTVGAFDEPARNLLIEMAMDISFALDRFADALERQQADDKIRQQGEQLAQHARQAEANAAALAASESTLRAMFDNAAIGVIQVATNGRLLKANRKFCSFLGFSEEELLSKTFQEIAHPDDLHSGECEVQAMLNGEIEQFSIEKRYRHRSGATMPGHLTVGIVRRHDGSPDFFVAMVEDISDKKKSQDAIRRLTLAVEQSPSSIVVTDLQANIVYANATFSQITGYDLGDVLGQNPRILHSGQTPKATYDDMWAHLTRGQRWEGEFINKRKDGSIYIELARVSPVCDEHGVVTSYLAIKDDITAKKEAEARIEHLAHFDQLTGLPNRTLLRDRFRFALSLAQRKHETLAVLYLDLDHFKVINDTLGHSVGDQLLMELGRRLIAAVRAEDTVSRQGGDEFILLLPGVDAAGATKVARKLMATVAEPFRYKMHELVATPSIGIALFPDDAQDMETLSQYADAAMYQAKHAGRNDFRFYSQVTQRDSVRRLQLATDLRHALARDELFLLYQPQVAMHDGRVIGAEALLRWQHPELGLISPAEFIPIAEDSGLIIGIGEWVLRTAATQAKAWINGGQTGLVMAVNLSAVQFRHADLFQRVSAVLQDVGLPASALELELTEAMAMDDPQAAMAMMNQFSGYGIRLSIDDFGTGYSSLSYLKRFQVYKLKIDQSFVRDIGSDPEDKAIVTAIINMASSLGLRTIAEGVETAEQMAFLRLHGCDEVQGYYFSKPLTAPDFAQFLARQNA